MSPLFFRIRRWCLLIGLVLSGILLVSSDSPAQAVVKAPPGLSYVTRYWAVTHTKEQSVCYFGSDGRFSEGLQNGFLASKKELDRYGRDKGSYYMEGNTLTLVFPIGRNSAFFGGILYERK